MDISISSNFERLLFDLYDGDAAQIAQLMADFSEGEINLTDSALARAQKLFTSAKISDEETCEEIRLAWQKTGQLLDPHTAIGTRAARLCARDGEGPTLPDHLADLFDREERFDTLDNDIAAVHAFMAAQCRP
jgi:threonine synthase